MHGGAADGLETLALELARSLAGLGRRPVLHVDCALFKSENDKTWLGHDPVWVGAAPGLLVEFLWRNPSGVVVFHRADESRAEVLAQLQGAFALGQLEDLYGLPAQERSKMQGSGRTVVNTTQAVFIFTVSTRSEWLAHPDAAQVLGQGAQRQGHLLKALRDAEFRRGKEATPRWDAAVLDALAPHHHVLDPVSSQQLRAVATQALAELPAMAQRSHGLAVVDWLTDPQRLTMLAELALATWGGDMGLHCVSAPALLRSLLGSALQDLVAQPDAPTAVRVGVLPAFKDQWGLLRQRWGDDLQAGCQRYQEVARAKVTTEPAEGDPGCVELSFAGVQAQAVRRLSDFEGGVSLVSRVHEVVLTDVAGHDRVKGFLLEMIGLLKQPHPLQQLGVVTPRGVLLYGAPGTGKTLLAKAVAGQAGLPFVSVAGPELLSLDTLQSLFPLVRAKPAIVVHVDEADVLGKRGVSAAHDLAINTLLAQLDGFHTIGQAFFILTTNKHPEEAFDDALLRSGRIDRAFEIDALDPAFGLLSLHGVDAAARFDSVSPPLQQEVVQRVRDWLDQADLQAQTLLKRHKPALLAVADALEQHGVIDQQDLMGLMRLPGDPSSGGFRRVVAGAAARSRP